MWVKTAQAQFSSFFRNALKHSNRTLLPRKLNGLPRIELPRDCVRCARIILHGAALKTRVSSASPVRNPRPLFSSSANGGEFHRAAFQPRIFSNRPRLHGMVTWTVD